VKELISRSLSRFGCLLSSLGIKIAKRFGKTEVWIDVGAHHGESSVAEARRNPGIKVYAVEPNLQSASKLTGHLPNYLVLPIAIAEVNGFADFHLNAYDQASSLLPFNEEGLKSWEGPSLQASSVVKVPTVRLDTLMNMLGVEEVDFLKIDAQGMDLAVLRSAGRRLSDIRKIQLEVWVAPVSLYVGTPSKAQTVSFLEDSGFHLVHSEKQSEGKEENLTFIRAELDQQRLPSPQKLKSHSVESVHS
jgi:FkbM family methyltransferase